VQGGGEATDERSASRTNWGRLLNEDEITPNERALDVPPSPRTNPRWQLRADW